MKMDIEELLHNRIIEYSLPIFNDNHFNSAALEAMKQVEIALKDKCIVSAKLTGENLIKWVMGMGKHIKLTVPFSDELQDKAIVLFKGAFSYYRNYAAHDGVKINKKICIRIMILSSELLDLIKASKRSYIQIGGVEGIIKEHIFKNKEELKDFLKFLDEQQFPYDIFDGFFEDMAIKGYTTQQYESVSDLGLIVLKSDLINHSMPSELPDYDNYSWFELTELGKKVIKEIDT